MDTETDRGSQIFTDQDMEAPLEVVLDGGIVEVYSARCPDKTTPNEDAVAVLPCDQQSVVIAVADGLGGVPAGEKASQLALQAIRDAVETADSEAMLRTAILNGFEQANQVVQQLAVGAATTLAVVEISGSTIRPYHVGDSMILLVGNRGKIKLQTVSHSPVGYGVEAGLLNEDEAMHHEDRHIVSNVVGVAGMRIEIGPVIHINARDTLVLASDGLVDNLQTVEIVERVRKGPLHRAARSLADDARRRMLDPKDGQPSKPDDLTFVVYRPRPR